MSARKRIQQQRGFTLVEILVTTAIFAVIMIAALAVYDQSNKVFKTSSESADLQQSTRIGFEKLISDLRMAGFDYNRGGIPDGTGQFAQPDEQIEFAGPSAIAFRANFDYATNAANSNGLAAANYTPVNGAGAPIFPYITTDNNEIVIYALRSTDATKNTSSISFYADTNIPRDGYPGGQAEHQVTLSNIDTTNANPPYTLYRITAADVLAGRLGTPLADNIRSMNFVYYNDTVGKTVLGDPATNPPTAFVNGHNAGGTTFSPSVTINGVSTYTGAIGGDGQYDPNNPGVSGNFNDRSYRSGIQSIRVYLVGMGANADMNYYNTDTTETIAAIKRYHQFSLSSLVVPRNLGLTGFPEPSFLTPSAPTVTGMCTGWCGAPVIYWTAPTSGGPVVEYRVEWDTNQNGTFQNSIYITDPKATSAVIPDLNPAADPTIPYYYRVVAINDNGAATSQPPYAASPINTTTPYLDPNATNLQATSNQVDQVTLQWIAPTSNQAAASTLSCSGSGGSTNGGMIPTQELMVYQVWRGTTPNFDPATDGVKVLDFSSAQPNSSPGAQVTWVDSPSTSLSPPAACVQYYYRIRAANRCVRNANWNIPNLTATATSNYFPAVGTAATNGAAANTSTPSAPVNLAVDTTHSACPDSPSKNCKVSLQWPKVTTDTAGNAIGVDTYRIKRSRKKENDPAFVADPTFTPLDVSGYTSSPAPMATWVDTSGDAKDNGEPWYYQYTVAAKSCGNYGGESPPAVYPTLCSINPVIVQVGAQNPQASGDTPQTAWIMGYGDTITVSPPTGATFTLQSVQFDVTTWPSGASVDTLKVTSSPFTYMWVDRTDLQLYQVVITVVNSLNCTEVHVKYVQDQQQSPCAFTTGVTPPAPSLTHGNIVTAATSFSITNSGTEPMQFNVGSFTGSIEVTWLDPDGQHGDMNMTSIAYTVGSGHGSYSSSDNFISPGSGIGGQTLTTLRRVPTNMPDVPAGGTFTITINYQYDGRNNGGDPNLVTTPLRKICLKYKIASEPTATKACNLVGQANSTANPSSCD
jgi:prepilin-type N-terminal cleavage/methylation domain-containing protein